MTDIGERGALTRLCPFCLEPAAECVCPDEETAYTAGAGETPRGPEVLTVLHAPAEGADEAREAGPPYRGVVIIEWPAAHGASPYSSLPGWQATVTDALTGKRIVTCTGIAVYAGPDALVTADLTLIAGADGEPVLEPDADGTVTVEPDGEGVLTGTFPFLVAEMRVRRA
jgi:hypothetical protein